MLDEDPWLICIQQIQGGATCTTTGKFTFKRYDTDSMKKFAEILESSKCHFKATNQGKKLCLGPQVKVKILNNMNKDFYDGIRISWPTPVGGLNIGNLHYVHEIHGRFMNILAGD